ncbi:hypothetical protein [Streptomyces sp. NPDC005078]|uniref:hypothetical protein n=1 Tax=unclassified Streptomyces TaxID=2593676 RepID=UPI0033B60CC4
MLAANDIELVFLPTHGSWLNWIESEFAALRYFALNGSDHRSHGEQNAAIGAYIRLRNARAEPKTNFAPDSPIRTDPVPDQGGVTSPKGVRCGASQGGRVASHWAVLG